MGSLSNLYISQSYISLIHLGSNNTASSTPTELQDGLGNGVGVSVSTNKNLYVSGNVYATNLTGSTINTGSLVTTASFNAYTASQDFKNTTFATTGSNVFIGNQTLSGSLGITGNINMVTGSDLVVHHIRAVDSNGLELQTSAGTNIVLMGAGGGTQAEFVGAVTANSVSASTITGLGNATEFSTSVDNRLDSLEIASGGFVTTSSFNSYTASQDFKNTTFATTSSVTDLSASLYFTDTTQSNNIASNSSSIGLLQTFSGSQYKNDSSSFDSRILAITSSGGNVSVQEEGSILGNATSFNFIGAGVTATLSAGTASVTIPGGGSIDTGSFATTGSNTFTGNQTINGAIVSNPTTSLTKLFSQAFVSSSVQYNITASAAVSQSNIVLGGTPLPSTQTGSVIISGSGNILFNPAKGLVAAASFTKGYVGGNNNYFTTIPTLHTQSLFNPTISANIGTGALTMNFITSSLGVPSISNNNFSATITLNHQSGTVSMANNISNGAFTSTQNGLTSGTVVATYNSNIIGGGGITLNHNSSSIVASNNIVGAVTVNNNYYHTGSNNSLTVASNLANGTTLTINSNGSPATNVARTVVGNLIGGQTITIQADGTGTDSAGLRNSVAYGYNLIVSGAHSVAGTTNQGAAFFGRYNDINSGLADSGKTIFAVGTGTSTSNRKTALSVDSSSVVMVSGSLSVTGSTIITGSNLSIDSSANVTASTFLATNNGSTAFIYNQQSTGSVAGVWNTNYGKDGLSVYQYQGQPYAFNVILTANQISAYTGSEFQWGLQTNGTLSLPGGGSTYFAMSSGSTITGSGGGATKVGLDYLETAMILDMKADTAFNRKVYVDKGMYVSQSVGGGKPALIVNGTNAANNLAIVATGSVNITGSLTLNGSTITSLAAGAFQSNINQSGSAGVSQSMQFEVTDLSYGVTIASNSRITLANAGTYNIQFSTQLLADTGADNVYIWLKKNGTNVSATAGHVTLANNDELIAAWNYVIDAAANDYYEIVWQSTAGDAILLAEAASGNIPSIPSVILTVTQVR